MDKGCFYKTEVAKAKVDTGKGDVSIGYSLTKEFTEDLEKPDTAIERKLGGLRTHRQEIGNRLKGYFNEILDFIPPANPQDGRALFQLDIGTEPISLHEV